MQYYVNYLDTTKIYLSYYHWLAKRQRSTSILLYYNLKRGNVTSSKRYKRDKERKIINIGI